MLGFAAVALWVGAGGADAASLSWVTNAVGNFGTASNWNNHNGPVPGSADTATIINGTVTVTTDEAVGTVNIGGSAALGVTTGSLTASTYVLNGSGQVTAGELGFSDSFSLAGAGKVLDGVELTGDGSATMSQAGANSVMAGSVTGVTGYTQSGGTVSGSVETGTYKLSGGSVDGTVDFSDSFAMSGTSTIGADAEITGGDGSTFTQSNGTVLGTITAGTYKQNGGTISGNVGADAYQLTGGSMNGAVDFSDTFAMSGNATIGADAVVTGDDGSTFTQSGGTVSGSVTTDTYKLTGGSIDGTVDFSDTFNLSGSATIDADGVITGGDGSTFTQSGGTVSGSVTADTYKLTGGVVDGSVDFSDSFTMSGNSTLGADAEVTGEDGSTFTQSNGSVVGSVSADTYKQSGGTVSGSVTTDTYQLTGGAMNGTVDFSDSFAMSGGSSTIGADAVVTGGDGSSFTQSNGTVSGSVTADTYQLTGGAMNGTVDFSDTFAMSGNATLGADGVVTGGDGSTFTQSGGTVSGGVTADTYQLTGGAMNGTVDFSDTFAMSGNATIGADGMVTGSDGSTFTQSNGTMSGSVTADTYQQSGGTVSGSVGASAYTLTGGSANGAIDFSGSFAMSGSSTVGADAVVTGGDGSIFTQSNGTVVGSVTADTYQQSGGTVSGTIGAGDYKLTGGTMNGTVDFSGTFAMSGNSTLGATAEVTGDAGSTFTQSNGTIFGSVSVGTYQLIGPNTVVQCLAVTCSAVAAGATITASTSFAVDAVLGKTMTIAGTLSGTAGLTKSGDSTLILSGSNDYGGETQVTGGVLQVDGAILNSSTSLVAGTLTGSGSLADVEIADPARHRPGNDGVGTQTIDGSYENHGYLDIDVTPGGADQVVVNGTVDIVGGKLAVHQLTGEGWSPSSEFTIIDNDGADAVVGTFGTVASDFAFLVPEVDTAGGDGNDVVLRLLRNDVDYSDVAETTNQYNVANAIETLGVDNPIYSGLLSESAESSRQIFDQLSGEAFASAKGMMAANATLVSDALIDRTGFAADRLVPTGPLGYAPVSAPAQGRTVDLWTSAYGGWRGLESDGNASAVTGNTGGVLVGLDNEVGDWTLGFAAGMGHSATSVPDLRSQIDSSDLTLATYGGRQWNMLELALGASYTRHLVSSQRHQLFPDDRMLRADYAAGTAQIFGRVGVPINLGAFDLTPYGEASYVRLDTDAITEKGGAGALNSAASVVDATFAQLGLTVSTSRSIGDGKLLRLRGDLAWKQASGSDLSADNSFVGGGAGFTVYGAPIASNFLTAGLGLDLDMSQQLQLHVDYGGEFANGAQSHKISAEIGGAF